MKVNAPSRQFVLKTQEVQYLLEDVTVGGPNSLYCNGFSGIKNAHFTEEHALGHLKNETVLVYNVLEKIEKLNKVIYSQIVEGTNFGVAARYRFVFERDL